MQQLFQISRMPSPMSPDKLSDPNLIHFLRHPGICWRPHILIAQGNLKIESNHSPKYEFPEWKYVRPKTLAGSGGIRTSGNLDIRESGNLGIWKSGTQKISKNKCSSQLHSLAPQRSWKNFVRFIIILVRNLLLHAPPPPPFSTIFHWSRLTELRASWIYVVF